MSLPNAIFLSCVFIALAIMAIRVPTYSLHPVTGVDAFLRLNTITGDTSICAVKVREDKNNWVCIKLTETSEL